jgi:hypothetical protein
MRKIEFKAKLDISFLYASQKVKWVYGFYIKEYSEGLNSYLDIIVNRDGKFIIDPSTLCQLITEIDGVKIFEYDCWWDKQFPKFFHYFFYNNYGILEKRLIFLNRMADFNKKQNGFKIVQVEQIQNNTNSIYIGNWHDGEQFLLDKIKELGNEN